MNRLDHLNVDLQGRRLIEASAGTGKTYAIALLYLRILVELKLEPKQILVVTYTEAATRELRGRIRSRIRDAVDLLDETATGDPQLQALCHKWPESERRATRNILDSALKSFDTAAIFTIHGFCLRALQENAFESGALYDTGLVTDKSLLLQEIVDDFWRQAFFSDSAMLLRPVLQRKQTPESLSRFVAGLLNNPETGIIPEFSSDDIKGIDSECNRLFKAVKKTWQASRQEIHEILFNDKGLGRAETTYRTDLLPDFFEQMDSFTADNNPFNQPVSFGKFCTPEIIKGTKKTGKPPSHIFFDLCDSLRTMVQERIKAFDSELISYCREQLPLRKQQKNIRFFDDLLNDLHTALDSERGAQLAFLLRTRYQAALIDEFQDTDPVQYDIFKTIYADTALPLFLIGDPKQAIYSFRGADIFAYMKAADDVQVDSRFTLEDNWRSTPELLDAFNLIFNDNKNPFIYNQIRYRPLNAGKKDGLRLKTVSDNAPLQIRLFPHEGLNITKANQLAPLATAFEISKLLHEALEGEALIGERPVEPGDIAVIVRSHRQAKEVRNHLVSLGIPCVLRSDITIFGTDEAAQVDLLLQAALVPGNESSVKAALVTDLLGYNGSDIAALIEDENAWESVLSHFIDYHRLWREKGFIIMSAMLMAREGIRGRLLRYPDGERRLTNLLHCFEVLHGKSHLSRTGMEGLVSWFSERLNSARVRADEEHQIRLETDEKAVKILTVHISKGLEYPIVFCPYMWGGLIEDPQVATFHKDFKMIKDFGSQEFEANAVAAREESLAESLRLLYVAVTRAAYRCYLFGGKVTSGHSGSRPETSPLAYLFHASDSTRQAKTNLVEHLAIDFLGLVPDDIRSQLQILAKAGAGTISISDLPDQLVCIPTLRRQDINRQFKCRIFEGTIKTDWRVTSFSSFAADHPVSVEQPDRDESISTVSDIKAGSDVFDSEFNIFSFPRGSRAGIFMHGIFEKLDFAAYTEADIEELVSRGLETAGYGREWQTSVKEMVKNVLYVPLQDGERTFKLSNLKQGSWLTELEFFFPLKFISTDLLSAHLKSFIRNYNSVDLNEVLQLLRFRPVRGMVRGFIDMVFEHEGRYYLLDWKSNHLGYCAEAYNCEAIRREMERNLYPLQYLFYTVALNRYLTLRVKDYDYQRDFGGVYYIFLRGVDSNSADNYGIFRDIPSVGLVNALTEALVASEGWCHADQD